MELLFQAIIIAFALQIIGFLIATTFKTDLITDLSYGLTFIIIALWVALTSNTPYVWILSAMIILWGLRLATHLFTRIIRMKKDARFDGIRESAWRFAKFWFFQAIAIIIILSPLLALAEPRSGPLPILSLIGVIIWSFGLVIEATADAQKSRAKNKKPGRWVDAGLFKYARHPNYFGEMLCWWGVFLYVSPFLAGWYWVVITSPLFITILLRYGSGVPLLEAHHEKKYGSKKAFQDYKKRTRLLIPLPKRL